MLRKMNGEFYNLRKNKKYQNITHYLHKFIDN